MSSVACFLLEADLVEALEAGAPSFGLITKSDVISALKLDDSDLDFEVVILGSRFPEPIRMAQKIFARDRTISTIVVAHQDDLQRTKRALQLALFVGDQLECISGGDPSLLRTTVENARRRTQSRRKHQRTLGQVNLAIGSAQVPQPVSSSVFLDQLLDYAPVGIALVDGNGKVSAWNRRASEFTAKTERQVMGESLETILEFAPPFSMEIVQEHFQAGSMTFVVNSSIVRFGEPVRSFECSLSALTSSGDSAMMVVFHDISRQLSATLDLIAEKAKVDALVAESTSAIGLMRGADLVFEIVNKKWAELVSPREYIGRKYVDIYPELVGTAAHRSHVEVFATGVPFIAKEMKLKVRSADGTHEYQYYDYSNVRILDGEGRPYGVYCNALNVTAQVKARLELEEAKLAAERANQTKTFFLANMSHEIRTPLGAIIGFTDLLKDRNLSTAEREQFLETISRNGKGLTRIIDDILDLAKVESGKIELEAIEFSFIDLLDEALDLFRERTKSKGLYLRLYMDESVPNRISSDPTRLRQIFINIIGNAVKFTERGGITIRVRAVADIDQKLTFTVVVQDTGIGILEEQRDRLFQPFSQADNSTTRKYGGTGLGLVLSGRLAKALGGTITVATPDDSTGSAFHIQFVAMAANPGSPAVAPSVASLSKDAGRALENVHILVAEDSPDNQFLIRHILTGLGARVETVSNGRDAYNSALANDFDLILMDIQMPIMDGNQATQALRGVGYKRPIIALTAHAMAEERTRSHEAGSDGHVTKPINQGELVKAIRDCIGTNPAR